MLSFQAPIGVSRSHIHLSERHAGVFFPHGLPQRRELVQPGQFVCQERLQVWGRSKRDTGDRPMMNLAIVGPARKDSVVELSRRDAKALGLDLHLVDPYSPTFRPGVVVRRAASYFVVSAVIAQAHLHISPEIAELHDVCGGELVTAEITSLNKCRRIMIHNVLVRVQPGAVMELHIDEDEANAADVETGHVAVIHKGAI